MASITAALARIKQSPLFALGKDLIEQLCIECGHRWRDRALDPATTIALFVQQIVRGNISCVQVSSLPGVTVSAQAYCEARSRLPLSVCQGLLTAVVEAASPATKRDEHLWHGHRTFHIDGSSVSMPDEPELRKAFGLPSGQKPGCGFPTAHLMVLFSAPTGLLLDVWISARLTGDVAQTPEAHGHLSPGDIVIGDDSFSGYGHLASLVKDGLHGLFPSHHVRLVDFKRRRPHAVDKNAAAGIPRSRWVRALGWQDQLVELFKPKQRPAWMSQQEWDDLPESILVREIRRTVRRGKRKVTITLTTTLLDPKAYPAKELMELQRQRWGVETKIKHLKTTMGMDVLRCKTEDGVRKEVAIFALVYNLVCCVMLEAARRQEVDVSRISFAAALYWVRHARPEDTLPDLKLVPLRPGRAEPRCRKRRPKKYPLMTRPREELRQALLQPKVRA